jgi:hypothetical protein
MDANIKGAVVALFIVIALFGLVAMGDHLNVGPREDQKRTIAAAPYSASWAGP